MQLPPGQARVVVDFWPPGLSAGLALAALGVLCCLALLLFGRRIAPAPGRAEPARLSAKAARAVAVGGPLALVGIVAMAGLLFQPSFDSLMADARDYVAQRWRKGDRVVLCPLCAGPSCARFEGLAKHSCQKRPKLDGKRNQRLWMIYTRPVQKEKWVKSMTEGYRVVERKRFAYFEPSLIAPAIHSNANSPT